MTQICYAVPYGDGGFDAGKHNPLTMDGLGAMRNGDVVFCSDSSCATSADWLVVGDKIYADFYTSIPRERRILFCLEPTMRKYPIDFIEQFGFFVSHYKCERYSGVWIESNSCIGWFAGMGFGRHNGPQNDIKFKKLSDVEGYVVKQKTRNISIISSLNKVYEGHLARVAFLEALQAEFGDRMDYFGREINPVDDKLDAIAPYKYHIAIENARENFYWTEKLADAWVGWSLPIYCGDPTILQQVPDVAGIEIIDVADIHSSIEKIKHLLNEDPYENRKEAIKKCREWVIKESNLYEKACKIIESADDSVLNTPRLIKLQKVKTFAPEGVKSKIYYYMASFFGRNTARKLHANFKKIQKLINAK